MKRALSSDSTDTPSSVANFITEQKAHMLYLQAPISNSVAIIISILIYFILEARINSNMLDFWLGALLLSSIFRMILWFMRKTAAIDKPAKYWLNLYIFACGLMGISWSLIYSFTYGASDPFIIATLLMLGFGVISSAIPILSPSMPAFILYTYPQALMLIVSYLRFDDSSFHWLSFSIFIYMVMLTLFTRNANKTFIQSVKLEQQNMVLIENLSREINQREEIIKQRTLELQEININHANAQRIAKMGSWEFTVSNRHLSLSDEMFQILEIDPNTKDSLGKYFFETVHPDDRMNVKETLNRSIENKTPYNLEHRLQMKDGRIKYVHEIGETSFDDNGNPIRSQGTILDITQSKNEEKEKQRLQNELQQAQKMESLGHLTGGVAHDFNNLLNIISGFTELSLKISKSNADEKLTNYLNYLKNASERATNLVSQMLSFSRVEQGDSQSIDAAAVLIEEVDMLRATLPSSIEIDLLIDDNIPSLFINLTKLQQVIMNLCINARDAMGGNGKLSIKLEFIENVDTLSPVSHKTIEGNWIKLSIADTGTGMQPELIDKIFAPFFTTKGTGKGTGMGLSVVHGIVENAGGHILVESTIGEGSCISLLFPPIIEETLQENLTEKTLASYQTTGQGESILVVDDEEAITSLMSEMLSNSNYSPTTINDSSEAYKLFKQKPDKFDMLITDQTMPRLTGIKLITLIRDIRPNLPVILCTGYSDKICEQKAEQQHFHFINKPLNFEKLIYKISQLFEKN